jgi:hypothetical protein
MVKINQKKGIKESTRIGPAAMGFFFVGHWDGGLVT